MAYSPLASPAARPAATPVARSAGPASPTCGRTASAAAWRSAASGARSRCRATTTVHAGRGSGLSVRWDSVRRDLEASRVEQPCAKYARNKNYGKSIFNKIFSHRHLRFMTADRTPPIDPFQQHRQLCPCERYGSARCLRPDESPTLQPLVTQFRMQMLRSQRRVLCGSRIRSIRSAGGSFACVGERYNRYGKTPAAAGR